VTQFYDLVPRAAGTPVNIMKFHFLKVINLQSVENYS